MAASDHYAQFVQGSPSVTGRLKTLAVVEDERHHVVAPSFAAWLDAFVYFPRIGPTGLLRSR